MRILGIEYPKEQDRVRQLVREYDALGAIGAFGAAMLMEALHEAEEAAISGDIPRMILAYQRLKDCK